MKYNQPKDLWSSNEKIKLKVFLQCFFFRFANIVFICRHSNIKSLSNYIYITYDKPQRSYIWYVMFQEGAKISKNEANVTDEVEMYILCTKTANLTCFFSLQVACVNMESFEAYVFIFMYTPSNNFEYKLFYINIMVHGLSFK